MGVHEEFEEPVTLTAEQRTNLARTLCPDAMALVDELKAIFPEGCKIMSLKSNGEEYHHRDDKPDHEYSAILTPSQFIRLGELGAENQKLITDRENRNAR